MSTTIDISVSGQSLLEQDAQNRRGNRQAWLEQQQDIEVERNAAPVAEGEDEAPPAGKQSKDEPAANRRPKKGMSLLPKYEGFQSPLKEDEKVYLFDGPLRKGPPQWQLVQQRFAMSFSTQDDEYPYDKGTYKKVRRLDTGGPKGAPVFDYTIYSEADAITNATGYTGNPDDGNAILDAYDPASVAAYKDEVIASNPSEKVFAWVGAYGIGFGSWLVYDPVTGRGASAPYIVRLLQNINMSFLGTVVYLPGLDESYQPEVAYLGKKRKTVSFYVNRLSGPPFKIVFSLGALVLILNHSYWNDFADERSRLEFPGGGRLPIALPFNTDSMSGWCQIALSVDANSYSFYVDGARLAFGPVPEGVDWDYFTFFPDALEVRQAMWSDVDFGDYMSRIQVSTIKFYQGGYKP